MIGNGYEGLSQFGIVRPEAHLDPVRRIRLEIDPLVAPSEMMRPSELLAIGPEVPLQYTLPIKAQLRFVIKRHRATRLHTDFRFEAYDRLLSWASYEKPSLDPGKVIRLREMGDHDPKYMRSERRIPDGSYGAGPMIVWDAGFYEPLDAGNLSDEQAVVEGLRRGWLDIRLNGVRLVGDFRFEFSGQGWLFRKIGDQRSIPIAEEFGDVSAISGRTLDHIEREYQMSFERRRTK